MTVSLLRAALLALAVFLAAPPASAMPPEADDEAATVEDADYERAVALIWAEEFAEAEPLLQASLKRDPRNADAWNYLGFVTRKQGKFAEARQYYLNALRLDPGHLQAMEYLGELYLESGEAELAMELLERLKVLCPAECEARDALAAAIAARTATN